ncbi:uncharacterized protein LOC144246952 [Lonchura striata]
MARCTFKKFPLTVDRYSSAIGFFIINSWQISPQNNVSQILMEKSVGLTQRVNNKFGMILLQVEIKLGVSITSTPSAEYIRIQIQSLGRADIQNHFTSAFIKVNGTAVLFTSTGIFFVVLDACAGAVMGRQHFDTVTSENPACAVTDYVQTSIKEREFCQAWL